MPQSDGTGNRKLAVVGACQSHSVGRQMAVRSGFQGQSALGDVADGTGLHPLPGLRPSQCWAVDFEGDSSYSCHGATNFNGLSRKPVMGSDERRELFRRAPTV